MRCYSDPKTGEGGKANSVVKLLAINILSFLDIDPLSMEIYNLSINDGEEAGCHQ